MAMRRSCTQWVVKKTKSTGPEMNANDHKRAIIHLRALAFFSAVASDEGLAIKLIRFVGISDL